MGARKSKEKSKEAQPVKARSKPVAPKPKQLKLKNGKGNQANPVVKPVGKSNDANQNQKPQYSQNPDQQGNFPATQILNDEDEFDAVDNEDEVNEAEDHRKVQEGRNVSYLVNEEEEESLYPYDEGCCRAYGDPKLGQSRDYHLWCHQKEHEIETITEDSREIMRLLRESYPHSIKKPVTNFQNFCVAKSTLFHFNENDIGDTHKPVQVKYTKIFATQVDDSHERQTRNNEDLMMWTSIFVFRVFAVLFFIHFLQAAIFQFPVTVRYPIVTAVPALRWIWVIVIPIALNIFLSIISVMNFWGGSFPTNFCVLLFFVTLWTLFWTTIGCSFDDILLFSTRRLAASAIFLQLLVTMILGNLGYVGDGTAEYVMYVICLSTFFASPIFLYIVVDVNAILEGNRPIAWPHQWIFGVLSVYQDWVWMIGEGMQMILYCFPCTYCKHSKHTVFRRWKFWNKNNYQNLYGGIDY
ncbi:unnamed protein product [Allacma fusca]|uniref:Uncharacterized protein n=1 Tax=Allacma fusca TaxID=39272 RepID=A0A8J2LIY2_9HEXA|nr:unnamed protein product [Allacma fusca]